MSNSARPPRGPSKAPDDRGQQARALSLCVRFREPPTAATIVIPSSTCGLRQKDLLGSCRRANKLCTPPGWQSVYDQPRGMILKNDRLLSASYLCNLTRRSGRPFGTVHDLSIRERWSRMTRYSLRARELVACSEGPAPEVRSGVQNCSRRAFGGHSAARGCETTTMNRIGEAITVVMKMFVMLAESAQHASNSRVAQPGA